jgi:hypothetical protein
MEKQEISINLNDALDVVCSECENNYFVTTFQIKKLSALVSPTGKETMIPIQMFQCSKCGHVNVDFLQ